MSEQNLKTLTFGVASELDPDFRAGRVKTIDVSDYVQPFARDVDLRPFNTVVDEAMKMFSRKDAAKSDEWLAPRLHHVLRLRRNEAAQHGVWLYLAVAARPDYVVWRWGSDDETNDPPGVDRFAGSETKHAFGRLWWTVELFRNGPDYEPSVKAFRYQDVPNNLFRMHIAHHRPTLQGAIATLFPDGKPLPRLADRSNALAKAANAAVTTLQLDVLAPDQMLDESAAKDWIDGAGDVDAVGACGDELPAGPEDPKVPAASVQTMTTLLTALLAEAPLRDRAAKSDADDVPDADEDRDANSAAEGQAADEAEPALA